MPDFEFDLSLHSVCARLPVTTEAGSHDGANAFPGARVETRRSAASSNTIAWTVALLGGALRPVALVAAQPQDDYRGAASGPMCGRPKGRGRTLVIAQHDDGQAESLPAEDRLAALGFSRAQLGGHAARSMMLREMEGLLDATRSDATDAEIRHSVLDDNALAKPTLSSRKKTLRHLKELYGLDSSKPLFRVLWSLAHDDPDSLPSLCLVLAYARDPLLRASFERIQPLRRGEAFDRLAMEQHLEHRFPDRFTAATKKSVAQNVATSWSFGGHLEGRVKKRRVYPSPRPASVAYAMLVGYLTGLRGERLLESDFAALVASSRAELQSALALASARGLISIRQAGGIVEFDFSALLTAEDQALVHESH